MTEDNFNAESTERRGTSARGIDREGSEKASSRFCVECGDRTAGPWEDENNPICRACRECHARRTLRGDKWDKRLKARRRGRHRYEDWTGVR